MTSSKKSTLAAVGMFTLIAGAVLGGMTWASAASFELAKKRVGEEHSTKVHAALRQIESHIKGVINFEASRRYEDYVDFHTRQPVAVLTDDGREVDAQAVILRSPIALDGPRFDWIDLYFQVDQRGRVSSPQFDEGRSLWSAESTVGIGLSERRARDTCDWFKSELPKLSLRDLVSEVLKDERETHGVISELEPTDVVRVTRRTTSPQGAAPRASAAGVPSRKSPSTGFGVRYVPPEDCIAPYIAALNFPNVTVAIDSGFEDSVATPAPVRIRLSPFAPPFWIGPLDEKKKLAFVRECHADADVLYQGFVGDWERLKPELLRPIEDLFPEADLEPVSNDWELVSDEHDIKLSGLPAVLRVPDIPGGTTAAAWRSIRGVILISWAAALTVLAGAGWGVRSLVALTERRMQFAYAVTHELRTPLTTFRLYSDMLSAGLVPDTSRQEYLDTLNRESQRLSSLVEAVLEYARLENHKVKLHVTTTDAAALLRVVGETVQKRCAPHAIESETRNGVPDAHPIHTDVSLVNQITAVLVDNACRHARGSRNPKVVVHLGGHNGRIHLDVVDSGPGIDLVDSRTIFKPFRRGRDADVKARGGIGLGLSLARNWAALLGGRLDLVARHDPQYGGAHFRLSIPTETLAA